MALIDQEIRLLVLGSLAMQILLIFMAPWRRQGKTRWLRFLTWLFYLAADAIAIYALGNISKSVGSSTCNNNSSNNNNTKSIIHVFWASFLILHLGGPDTITAFDLEDNELWKRHLIQLLVQTLLTFYLIFFLTLRHNPLIVPTVLVFVAGFIKYAERNRALYLASTDRFRKTLPTAPHDFSNVLIYQEMSDMHSVIEEQKRQISLLSYHEHNNMLGTRQGGPEPKNLISEVTLVKCGYIFFSQFKGMFLDDVLPSYVLSKSKRIMLMLQAEEAFRVIEMELDFLYQVLYTKGAVVHTRWGYFFRSICFCAVVVSFLMFGLLSYKKKKKKHDGFGHLDIAITYTLLGGAMALEILALAMIVVSYQTMISLQEDTLVYSLLTPIILWLRSRWSRRQSSMIIPQFNLIGSCISDNKAELEKGKNRRRLGKCMNLIIGKLAGMLGFTEGQVSYETEKLKKLNEFIFNELVEKSKRATDWEMTKQFFEERGERELKDLMEKVWGRLLRWGHRRREVIEFDESILVFHIATDMCYYTRNNETSSIGHGASSSSSTSALQQPCNFREISKVLSDYMLYLLVKEETMMSPVMGIGMLRYRDTCIQVKEIDIGHSMQEACIRLVEALRENLGYHLQSKSVISFASMLAEELKEMGEGRWEVIATAWVKLLSYAAGHINGISHGKQLSRGGGLLTSVSFLMANLGLVRDYTEPFFANL